MTFLNVRECNHSIEISDINQVITWLKKNNELILALKRRIHNSLLSWDRNASLLPPEQIWIKHYLQLMEFNHSLNQLMSEVSQHYLNAIQNPYINSKSDTKNQWLQLEYAARVPRGRKVHSIFSSFAEYKEGLIHWRIGAYYDNREYSPFMLNAKGVMKKCYLHETPEIKKVINQFDEYFLGLFSMRQFIRKIEFMIVDGWEMAQLSKQLFLQSK